jgi:hypothetical protein
MSSVTDLCNPSSVLLVHPKQHFKIIRNAPNLQKGHGLSDPQFKREDYDLPDEPELPPITAHYEAPDIGADDDLLERPKAGMTEEAPEGSFGGPGYPGPGQQPYSAGPGPYSSRGNSYDDGLRGGWQEPPRQGSGGGDRPFRSHGDERPIYGRQPPPQAAARDWAPRGPPLRNADYRGNAPQGSGQYGQRSSFEQGSYGMPRGQSTQQQYGVDFRRRSPPAAAAPPPGQPQRYAEDRRPRGPQGFTSQRYEDPRDFKRPGAPGGEGYPQNKRARSAPRQALEQNEPGVVQPPGNFDRGGAQQGVRWSREQRPM